MYYNSRKLGAAFAAADVDGDGVMSIREFTVLAASTGLKWDDEQVMPYSRTDAVPPVPHKSTAHLVRLLR